jgi:hypothetical protein
MGEVNRWDIRGEGRVLFSVMVWSEAVSRGLTAQESEHGTFRRAGRIGCRDEHLHRG